MISALGHEYVLFFSVYGMGQPWLLLDKKIQTNCIDYYSTRDSNWCNSTLFDQYLSSSMHLSNSIHGIVFKDIQFAVSSCYLVLWSMLLFGVFEAIILKTKQGYIKYIKLKKKQNKKKKKKLIIEL